MSFARSIQTRMRTHLQAESCAGNLSSNYACLQLIHLRADPLHAAHKLQKQNLGKLHFLAHDFHDIPASLMAISNPQKSWPELGICCM